MVDANIEYTFSWWIPRLLRVNFLLWPLWWFERGRFYYYVAQIAFMVNHVVAFFYGPLVIFYPPSTETATQFVFANIFFIVSFCHVLRLNKPLPILTPQAAPLT